MQIGRARESWQIHLPDLAWRSNLHEPHQNKNHYLYLHFVWVIQKFKLSQNILKRNINKNIQLQSEFNSVYELVTLFSLVKWHYADQSMVFY